MPPRCLLIALLLLAGCGYSPDRFGKKSAAAWCAWRRECEAIDEQQLDYCLSNEQDVWNGWLSAYACEYERDRSRQLLREFKQELELIDCSLSEGYALLGELKDDICDQPHSPTDSWAACSETGIPCAVF